MQHNTIKEGAKMATVKILDTWETMYPKQEEFTYTRENGVPATIPARPARKALIASVESADKEFRFQIEIPEGVVVDKGDTINAQIPDFMDHPLRCRNISRIIKGKTV